MRKKKVVYAAACLCLFALSGFNWFFSSGIVGVTKKPNHIFENPGCICHNDTLSPNVQVWITGPETLAAGDEALYQISVAKDSSIAAGFNVASFFGSLGVVESLATQLIYLTPSDSAELTHYLPREANGVDTISWWFSYRAPLIPGIVDTLYAASNSVDLNGDPTGDAWNFASNVLIHVTPSVSVNEPDVPARFSLAQNYPNPFNPTTRIAYEIPAAGRTTLAVFDLRGRHVQTLVDEVQQAGNHEAEFGSTAPSGLASGVYLYRLVFASSSDNVVQSSAGKMILVK